MIETVADPVWPTVSVTMYEIVTVPVNPETAVKVTLPLDVAQVPLLATTTSLLAQAPGVVGSSRQPVVGRVDVTTGVTVFGVVVVVTPEMSATVGAEGGLTVTV